MKHWGQELYWNRFSEMVEKNGGRIVLHSVSVLDLHKTSRIEVRDLLEIGFGHIKGSKAETFLKMQENAKFKVNGHFKLSYGATIQVFKNGELCTGRCFVNSDSVIACCRKITIGNHVTIARGVKIYDGDHHTILDANHKMANAPQEIIIGDHVWIGVNAVILKGVSIGEGAVVAAGAIVTKDVPPHTMVAGNPARVIKEKICWE